MAFQIVFLILLINMVPTQTRGKGLLWKRRQTFPSPNQIIFSFFMVTTSKQLLKNTFPKCFDFENYLLRGDLIQKHGV